ncbi:hypothetical protein YW5DRAFT_01681 [Streptomyces sp. Ncost-T6T-1]|nr:hypothetical protein YW5DRAFT_01681 [Streptomyces sp. Ncost-T6T-1]
MNARIDADIECLKGEQLFPDSWIRNLTHHVTSATIGKVVPHEIRR